MIKTLKAVLLSATLALGALNTARAGESIPPIDFSTYATLSLDNLAGKGRAGTGAEVALGLSSSVKAYGFAEADDFDHSAIDRFGGGARIVGKLGRWLEPFAEIGAGYDTEREATFVRPGAGLRFPIYRKPVGNSRTITAALFGKWNLDVDTEGGARQRVSGGVTLGF